MKMDGSRQDPVVREYDLEWLDRMPPQRLFSLEGKVAVITGASGGIGRWLCAALGAAGARIVAADLALEPIQRMGEALAERGVEIHPVTADLADDSAPEQIVRAAVERYGRLDVLVNNAGINKREPILEVTQEFLEYIWRVDYLSCYKLSREAARIMIEQGGGVILHIGSLGAHVGLEDVSAYGPLKAGLSLLAKVQAVEWSRFGIRANVLAPSFFATPINASHWKNPTRAPWIMDRVPMCRPGHPAELVGTALLLVSDASSFITGQTILVDGGFTAGSRWNVAPGTGYQTYLEKYAPKD
jgi:NAD(P)-dependent dehydrogenase (short-subunit alcohol dehydrogenase family)